MDGHAVAWVHRGPAVHDRGLHLGARTGLTTTSPNSPPCASGAEGTRQPH